MRPETNARRTDRGNGINRDAGCTQSRTHALSCAASG
jgi:hypothetical protein